MWLVAGILLGVVVLASLAGFHTGPHAHVVAGVAGVLVAAWFVFMLVDGRSAPVLWALLGADLIVTAGVGITAWKVATTPVDADRHFRSLEAEEGVAVSDLTPVGIVRVRGEQWSAASVNGNVRSGSRVQVLRAGGVRLEVWGEGAEDLPTGATFSFDRTASKGKTK
jgi:membrane-bound ClpP family serine protease